MKKGAGAAVVAAVAIAAMRFSPSPASHAPQPLVQARSLSNRHTEPKPAPDSDYSGGCSAFYPEGVQESVPKDENRGAAKEFIDKFFGLDPLKDTADALPARTHVRYAVVLAPDPRHTNLSVMFDRWMVVLQQAAQDEGFIYNSSWLPWRTEAESYPLLADKQIDDDQLSQRESCPGILLFRRGTSKPETDPYDEALVVLVVGEQPTGGLNEYQWANAIHWLARNAPPSGDPNFRIVGPAFSGSLVSLYRDLDRIYRQPPSATNYLAKFSGKFPQVRILSGNVSGCAPILWFQERLASAFNPIRNKVVFGSFQENDEMQIYRFISYLEDQHTEGKDVAVISEDETAYTGDTGSSAGGGDPSKTDKPSPCDFKYSQKNRPVRLFYPRDISALRSAYQKQSVFSSARSASAAHAIHSILQEDVESESGSLDRPDSIQAFSGGITPLAQEAVLYGLVSTLRTHHIRYLLLRCTNPLDYLFLTRFFHQAYPEGRVVTVGSDLLFRREIDTTEFRGVMALTNYPLLPRNQHWSELVLDDSAPAGDHADRIFESQTEGAYIAARYNFGDFDSITATKTATSLALTRKKFIPDFADPFWLHRPGDLISASQAPTWLTVLGRDGYWPVAVLTAQTTPAVHPEKGKDDDPELPPPPSTLVTLTDPSAHYARTDPQHFDDSMRIRFPLPWKLSAGCALLLLLYQLWALRSGKNISSSGLFLPFRPVFLPSLAARPPWEPAQAVLVALNSAIALTLLLEPLSVGLTLPGVDELLRTSWEFYAFFLVAIAAGCIFTAYLKTNYGVTAASTFAVSILLLCLVSITAIEFSLSHGSGSDSILAASNNVPLFYRIAHLTGGISPLLPVLLMGAGFYLWSWQSMAGNSLLRSAPPLLPCAEPIGRRKGRTTDPCNRPDAVNISQSHYRISWQVGRRILYVAGPLSVFKAVAILPAGLALGAVVCFHKDLPLLSLESHAFAFWVNLSMLAAMLLIAAEASRMFITWTEFRRLLTALNRLRLRRTFARLTAIEAHSLWSMSGSVQRVQYLIASQQLDAAIRLDRLKGGTLPHLKTAIELGREFAHDNGPELDAGPNWQKPVIHPATRKQHLMREALADACAEILNEVLESAWQNEDTSLSLNKATSTGSGAEYTAPDLPLNGDPAVQTAEELVCLQYIAFIQNVLARMRTITLSMVSLFLSVCLAISFYPFVPRTEIGIWMVVNLALIGTAVIYVYAGMERDETLSYISKTKPGELSSEFWLRSAGFLAGPMLGILATQFPSFADSILGWVQPGLDAISK